MLKILIKFLYFLDKSKKYKFIKGFFKNILDNNSCTYKVYFDTFMIFLVLSTIGILIYDVNHHDIFWLDTYEYTAILIFIVEWISRVWVHSNIRDIILKDYEQAIFLRKKFRFLFSLTKVLRNKIAFMLSPMSIVDLLAILPYYRPIRILRIFLLFRLLKILRYANSLKEFLQIFAERKFELYTLAILTGIVVFFGSTIFFVYEGNGINTNIHNYFDAVYWAMITIATVGYGDIVPITPEGKFVTLLLIINGFLVIAFSTSIVTTGLSEKMASLKQKRVEHEVNKIKSFIVICGYKIMGKTLAEYFYEDKTKFLIIDNSNENIKAAKEKKFLAIKADPSNVNILRELGIAKGASTVIATSDDDLTNLSIVLSVKTLNPKIKIIARANDEELGSKLKLAGADFIVNRNDLGAYIASEYIRQAIAFEAIDNLLVNNDMQVHVDEIEISENMNITNKDINKINFDSYSLILLGVLNEFGEFIFSPTGEEFIVKEKNTFIVIGQLDSIREIKMDFMEKI